VRLHSEVLHVYVFGHIEDAERRVEQLGLERVPGKPVWRVDAEGVVEAIKVSDSVMLICLGDERRRKWTDLPSREGRTRQVHLRYALHTGGRHTWQEAADAIGEPEAKLVGVPRPGSHLLELRGVNSGIRTIALVAPELEENEIDSLVWPEAIGFLPPVPSYLREAFKLADETSALDKQHRPISERRSALVNGVSALFDNPKPETAEEDLRRLQWRAALVAADEARLRVQALTADAIIANMAVADSWPLATDLTTARWLAAEITAEADRSHQAVALAEPIARAVEASNNAKLRELSERTHYLITVQASVIAAVLLVLGAAQTTEYDWPTALFLKLPLIVTLGLAALIVPIWATQRPTADHPKRRPPRWLAAPAVALGASTGWLVASAMSELAAGRPAPTLVSIGAAVFAGGLVAAAARGLPGRNRATPAGDHF
jgi:hypothetical protein